MSFDPISASLMEGLCEEYRKNNYIDPDDFARYEVKRGIRNTDATGLVAGVTQIANVRG